MSFNPSLLFHTLRYLKFRQVAGRLRQNLLPYSGAFGRCLHRAVPAYQGCRLLPDLHWRSPGPQNNRQEEMLAGRFSFIHEEHQIDWPPEWDTQEASLLWLYNLHYFEWLWALDFESARLVVRDWIEHHSPGGAHTGWAPYPVSLRLMNWCGVFLGKHHAKTHEDASFLGEIWRSIALQAEWLWLRRETHLLGNHYLENGAALAFVGSCFEGPEAGRWFRRGMSILSREIPEQILPDGLHFERSPMYHLRVVYLLLLLYETGRADLKELVRAPLERALSAMVQVCHPDGDIALFNDSAFGIYNTPQELADHARSLGLDVSEAPVGPWALPDAGYYGFRDAHGNYIICDAGKIGPDYIPGHAHADLFSFELSLKGARVIVDSGVHDYGRGAMRDYCRSTKAHNTVEINGQDQCEMWAAFRVARRGKPHNIKWIPSKNGFQLSAWHDGYRRLKGSPVHYREFVWNKSGKLIVKDIISASKPQRMVSRLHLHPNCEIDRLDGNTAWLTYPAGKVKITFSDNGKLLPEESYYCLEFGVKISNRSLAFSFSGSIIGTEFQIEAL